jgi:hypothetical protein
MKSLSVRTRLILGGAVLAVCSAGVGALAGASLTHHHDAAVHHRMVDRAGMRGHLLRHPGWGGRVGLHSRDGQGRNLRPPTDHPNNQKTQGGANDQGGPGRQIGRPDRQGATQPGMAQPGMAQPGRDRPDQGLPGGASSAGQTPTGR